ncbi:hypothetical protein [Janthinobacterium sp. ZB1P44]|uniref:hypothetical protein n=1 Tax=Janthinobacterium sp. ZB1P44 TaxID=3424192 RepID=UPI003F279F1F
MAGVPVDPWSAGLMAAGGIAKSAMQPGGPSSAGGNQQNNDYDGSAWSVSVGTGSGSTSASATNAKTDSPVSSAAAGLFKNPLLLIGLAAALYFVLRK